jgi:hypothetical protein
MPPPPLRPPPPAALPAPQPNPHYDTAAFQEALKSGADTGKCVVFTEGEFFTPRDPLLLVGGGMP